jgi:hypothetical protein
MKEIIIVRENIAKIKNFLDQEHINYEIYQEPHTKIFANYGRTLKDKVRESEAEELENAENEDIVNEE